MTTQCVFDKKYKTSTPYGWALKAIPTSPPETKSFEDWARVSHLKEATLEVLRNNDIDSVSTVRLLNPEDIKKLPIKLGQAKLLEYAVKKMKRADASGVSLNTSKETSYSDRGSSPERKSDSFYIVPSPSKNGRRSPTKYSQVEVDEEDPDDPEGSPCTIRITIETKKEEDEDRGSENYIARNLIEDLTEVKDSVDQEEEAEELTPRAHEDGENTDANADNAEAGAENSNQEEEVDKDRVTPKEENDAKSGEDENEEDCVDEGEEQNLDEANANNAVEEGGEDADKLEAKKESDEQIEKEKAEETGNEEDEKTADEKVEQGDAVEEKDLEVNDQQVPEGEVDTTRTDIELEVKGEEIVPTPEPIVVPDEVKRVILEANESELAMPVNISYDRRELTIPSPDSMSPVSKEDIIKHAARRIVADSISDVEETKPEQSCNDDEEGTRNRLSAFLNGAYGSTLIRLSNDHGTLKFLVPQLSEAECQTEECAENAEAEAADEGNEEQAKEDEGVCDSRDVDSISGELSTPLEDDLPPPDGDAEKLPEPPADADPAEGEGDDVPVGVGRKDSADFDPDNNTTSTNFHTPKGVNRFGNYMQVQMLGEDLKNPPSQRRPMSPVVSQPIRWECNRAEKGSPPKGSTPNKNTSPVRHRTPSPQRFKSPDRTSRGVSNGMPAGAAYKSSGEIDPKLQQSPPKEIVSKLRNTIESPKREPKSRSPPKPRSPSPVKPFDTESFRLARKLAQEVADCPPDCIMVRVKDLQKCPKALLPPELDKASLERYISDTEFARVFKMSRDEFDEYSEWKQQEIKKELGLF